jgi:hypothetical protein
MTDPEKLAHKRINLVATKNKMRLSPLETLFFLILLLLIGVFAKFAVYDPVMNITSAAEEVQRAQHKLDALVASNVGYDALVEEHAKYIVEGLSAEEQRLVDPRDVIDMLKKEVMDAGSLSSVVVADNVVTVTCIGIDLQATSALVEHIEADKRVAFVTISTAESQEDVASKATIVITMKDPAAVAEETVVPTNSALTPSASSTKEANNGE